MRLDRDELEKNVLLANANCLLSVTVTGQGEGGKIFEASAA